MQEPNSTKALPIVFAVIMVSLMGWGIFHAVGAYRFNHHPGRALMVLACVTAFLGFWGLMLWSRRKRLARQANRARSLDD
jgi:protein-S-isoprenylcysteine O-methyltransferase Ste14